MTMISSRNIRILALLLTVLHTHSAVHADLVNRTIDDTNGDSVTGILPSYTTSEDGWNLQSACSSCWSHLDTGSVYDGTWHDATYDARHPSAKAVNISFTGEPLSFFAIHSATIITTLS